MNRFDRRPCRLVDLWTAASAPAHNLHKASKSKQKRTNDVLPKPDKSECYGHPPDGDERTPSRMRRDCCIGAKEEELFHTIFPHPTLSETMKEAVLDAYRRMLNI